MYGAASGLGMDLLDIDLEPMATPRSIPTITPRELETLRSELQSRISGLEATLSGKEAEVMALKRAVTDAEVRVGKTSEELRNERATREELEHTKEDLERRTREMEEVLREVKQNIFLEEREKEKLRKQAEEAERKTEEHEVRILELQASLDTLRSERVRCSLSPEKADGPATPGMSADIDFAVKDATEKVARELHALYKGKHERKVADLKVSYEKRWIKQVEQLRADLKASQDEVLRLQTEKEATMSGVLPGQSETMHKMEGQIEELRRWNEENSAVKKMLEAETAGLRSQVDSLTSETESLRKEIEQERIEKGDLVAQVDLFLAISAQQEEQRAIQQPQQPVSPPRSEDGNGRPNSASAVASPHKSRNSLSGADPRSGLPGRPRPVSMLQKPTAGKYSGIPAPGSGLKAPSSKATGYGGRIMEGIARMGAGGR
jgi:chromosome segregation ATPase